MVKLVVNTAFNGWIKLNADWADLVNLYPADRDFQLAYVFYGIAVACLMPAFTTGASQSVSKICKLKLLLYAPWRKRSVWLLHH